MTAVIEALHAPLLDGATERAEQLDAIDAELDFTNLTTVAETLLRQKGFPDPDIVAREAVAKAWEHRDQYKPGTNSRAWVARIAVNHAIDRYRASQQEKGIPTASDLLELVPATDNPEQEVVEAASLRRIDALMDQAGVNKNFRLPIQLFALGYGQVEIGKILGRSKGTIGSQMSRALEQIRKHHEIDVEHPDRPFRDLFLEVNA